MSVSYSGGYAYAGVSSICGGDNCGVACNDHGIEATCRFGYTQAATLVVAIVVVKMMVVED